MTCPQIEVITTVQRRRRWSLAKKERPVAAAPGFLASPRKRGILSYIKLYGWRRAIVLRATRSPPHLLRIAAESTTV
jgi:transposase